MKIFGGGGYGAKFTNSNEIFKLDKVHIITSRQESLNLNAKVMILCRSSDSYVQMISIHALASPSQPGLSRSVTCFRRKSCAPYLQHELRALLAPRSCSGFSPDSLVQRTRMRVPLSCRAGSRIRHKSRSCMNLIETHRGPTL